MDFGNLFKFESAEETQRKQLEYQKKVFPLGLEQREMALNALRPLISAKLYDTDILFAFISAKQRYIDNPDSSVQNIQSRISNKRFSEAEKKYIIALVLLDTPVKTLEQYPTTDEIKLKAEAL